MLPAAYVAALLLGAASRVLATPSQDATTLQPGIHWSYDTSALANIVPHPANKGAELYYGLTDPAEAGHFAFIKYYFKHPSVNIDHSDNITAKYDPLKGLTVSFTSKEAFDHASESWSAKDGLVLVAHVPGCDDYDGGKRCFFSADELDWDEAQLSVLAKGSPTHPDDVTHGGETVLGWWHGGKPASTDKSPPGDFANKPLRERARNRIHCKADPDAVNGLPTACAGDGFDQALDRDLGFEQLTPESAQYLTRLMSNTTAARLSRRWLERRNFFKKAAEWLHKVADALGMVGDYYDGNFLQGSFSKDYSISLPDPTSPHPLPAGLTSGDTPWGEGILLKKIDVGITRFGMTDGTSLSVYCIDCGVSASVTFAGHAVWSTTNGLQEGEFGLQGNFKIGMKVGVDGSLMVAQQFGTNLFNYGLPGLSWGIITVGPFVSLDLKATISGEARGSLLVGGQYSLQNAGVVVNLADETQTAFQGWDPSFTSTFEVSGKLVVSAELSLPISFNFGVQVSQWGATVGVIEEPTIKGIALGGGTPSADKDACHGINTEITWSNRLWAGPKNPDGSPQWYTGDRLLAAKCLVPKMPSHNDRRSLDSGSSSAHDDDDDDDDDNNNNNNDIDDDGTGQQQQQPAKDVKDPVEPYQAYDNDAHIKSTRLLNPDGSAKLVSCPDGNVYAVANNNQTQADEQFCYEKWDTTRQRSDVVMDNANRPLHYYKNTMTALGVSRLRVANAARVPRDTVTVALVPVQDGDNGQQQEQQQQQQQQMALYAAVDPDNVIFFPVVCFYVKPKTPAKVFLVRDPDHGPEILQSKDLIHTVTGGEVSSCMLLPIQA